MASIEKKIHEVIVIGGGLMGSSAAWHLSNYDKEVLLIEKQGKNYYNGSSKGEARIVRSSNIENDELWSYLHNCAVHETKILMEYLNSKEITTSISDIYTTSPISYLARIEELDLLLNNLKKQNIDFEIASTIDEGNSKFEVKLQKGTFLQREYNEHSGTLNPRKLIQSLHKAVALKSNRIYYETKVKRVEKEQGLYSISVQEPDGICKTLYTKQVISATGPYTGQVLKNIAPNFDGLIYPKRVFLAFVKIRNEHYQTLTEKQKEQLKNGFPIIDKSIDLRSEEFFAMIENYDSSGNPIIKIGGHYHRSAIINLDEVWNTKLSAEEVDWTRRKTIDYFKLLNLPIEANQIEVVDEYSCVYSLTKTEVPYVTPILGDENFVVMAGMSGVGAKGAMAYGLIAANLLTNKEQEDYFFKTAVAKLGHGRLETNTL